MCIHPKGELFCLGEKVQSRLCNSRHCPGNSYFIFFLICAPFIKRLLFFVNNKYSFLFAVNGNYTDWSSWTSCSTTCGVGVRTRNRTCSNPMPQFKGKSCEEQGLGLPNEAEHCYMRQCGGQRNQYINMP